MLQEYTTSSPLRAIEACGIDRGEKEAEVTVSLSDLVKDSRFSFEQEGCGGTSPESPAEVALAPETPTADEVVADDSFCSLDVSPRFKGTNECFATKCCFKFAEEPEDIEMLALQYRHLPPPSAFVKWYLVSLVVLP